MPLAVILVLTLGAVCGHAMHVEFMESSSSQKTKQANASYSGKEAADVYVYSWWSMFRT